MSFTLLLIRSRLRCEFPTGGLNYNARLATIPGGVDIISPGVDPNTGCRRVATLGNLGENFSKSLHDPTPRQTYYCSVERVDSSFAGYSFAGCHLPVFGRTDSSL